MVDRILKGEGHGSQVGLSGPDVAALPLQHNWRGGWLVIPTQQEYLEDAEVVGLNSSQHGDFNHGFCGGQLDCCKQRAAAENEDAPETQGHVGHDFGNGGGHMRGSLSKATGE